jgi:hypothetical protein
LSFARILQLGAAPVSPSSPVASVDELADQVSDVLDFFGYIFSSYLKKLSLLDVYQHC